MKKVFVVRLTEAERSELDALVRKGKTSALAITRARILLKADQGKDGEAQTDVQVAEAVSVAAKTVFNVRRRWVEEGLEAALRRKKQDCPSRSRKLDGKAAMGPSGWKNANLRTWFTNRETELVEQFPVQVVTAWLGNTPAIAMRHYLQVRDSDYERAINGNGNSPRLGRGSQLITSPETAGLSLKFRRLRRGLVGCIAA